MSLPTLGVLLAKGVVVVVLYCYLFNPPLCALSAFESLGCPRAAVLRDLKRGLVGLGAEWLWDTVFQEDLGSLSTGALLVCAQEDLSGMLAALFVLQARGRHESEDHTRGPVLSFTTVP